jgi:FHS family glucose/mannose:H+ symporter-like MFS transporter
MVQGLVKNKSSVVNLGHVFLALGALTSPLIASNLIARGFGWRIIFYIIIFLVLVSSILYIVFEKRKKQVSPESIQKPSFKKIFKYRNKNIFLVLSLVILVFYFIQETIIFTWYPTFLRLGRSFDVYSAGYVISVFWVGIMVGRLIISVLSYKVRADHILFGLCILSLISLSIAIFSNLEILNYIGIGLAGLGFSGFVPLMIASSSSIFENQKDMVLTILLSIGIASNTLAPVIIKATSSHNLIMSVAITIIFMFMSGVFIIIRYFYQKNIR